MPNASALALAPFTQHIGSASALLGFMQLGISSLISSLVGLLNTSSLFPVAAILVISTGMAGMILFVPFIGILKLVADHNPKWKTYSMILGTSEEVA